MFNVSVTTGVKDRNTARLRATFAGLLGTSLLAANLLATSLLATSLIAPARPGARANADSRARFKHGRDAQAQACANARPDRSTRPADEVRRRVEGSQGRRQGREGYEVAEILERLQQAAQRRELSSARRHRRLIETASPGS